MQLSKKQMEAVTTTEGQLLVISCPGSGKTSTVINRVKYMVEEKQIPGENILVVTFSKAAANEMMERFLKLTGQSVSPVTFSTIHSFCYQAIAPYYRITPANILRESEGWMIVRKGIEFLMKENKLEMAGFSGMVEFTNSCLREISVINNNYTSLNWSEYVAETCSTHDFQLIYELYENEKRKMEKIDFDDMLKLCRQMLMENPHFLDGYRRKFRYIIVDEYQDTNFLQRDILYLLAGPSESANICVVGDDDQSIYKFRGARPEIMLGFNKDYPNCKSIYMSVNYRSEPKIIESAKRLIEKNTKRFKKDIKPNRDGKGVVEPLQCKENAEEVFQIIRKAKELKNSGISYDDMAILFRNNNQGFFPSMLLMRLNIPFHSNDKLESPYKHWIFQDLLAFYRLSNGCGTNQDLIQVINRPQRYIPVECLKYCDLTEKEVIKAVNRVAMEDWKLKSCIRSVHSFFQDLNLLKDCDPQTFIQMVMRMVGYDSYLKNFAKYRNMDPEDFLSLVQSYIDDAKQEGIETFEDLIRYGQSVNQKIDQINENKAKDGISLSTMHKAKGLEWDVVFILGADDGIMPSKYTKDVEEERRLFYVAATRAKKQLYVAFMEDNSIKRARSRFVSELFGYSVEEDKKTSHDETKYPKFKRKDAVTHADFGDGIVLNYCDNVAAVKFSKEASIRKFEGKELLKLQKKH